VPLDGSELAETILVPVRVLARARRLELSLLHVVARGVQDASADCERSRTYLKSVRTRLGVGGFSAAHVVVGDPAETIHTVARQLEVNIVALATHGRGGLARAVLGSVADQVLRRARVPLLVTNPRLERFVSTALVNEGMVPPAPGAA